MIATIEATLQALTDKILEECKFFQNGYAYARILEDKGLVVVKKKFGQPDFEYVGISDIHGNYFYFRVTSAIPTGPATAKVDCNVAIVERYPVTFVAFVRDADELILKDMLLNFILKTKVATVKSQNMDPISILKTELAGLKDEEINGVRANIGTAALIKIDFELQRTFETNNCKYSPCKTCQ